jgi:hypothetical protein
VALRGGGDQEMLGPNYTEKGNTIINNREMLAKQIEWLSDRDEENGGRKLRDNKEGLRDINYLRKVQWRLFGIRVEREDFHDLGTERRRREGGDKKLKMTIPQFNELLLKQSKPIVLQRDSNRFPVPVQAAAAGKQKPSIVIKQTVKQIQGASGKRRNKKVRFNNNAVLKKLKKQYSDAKKRIHKELVTKKKLEYESRNKDIKLLPAHQRKAARKKVRDELTKKMKGLKSLLLPISRLKQPGEVEAAIKSTKKLKW